MKPLTIFIIIALFLVILGLMYYFLVIKKSSPSVSGSTGTTGYTGTTTGTTGYTGSTSSSSSSSSGVDKYGFSHIGQTRYMFVTKFPDVHSIWMHHVTKDDENIYSWTDQDDNFIQVYG